MATLKPKRYNSPGVYKIPAELIKAGGRTIHSWVIGENYEGRSEINASYLFPWKLH